MELIEYGTFQAWPYPSSRGIEFSSKQWKKRLGLRQNPFDITIENDQINIRATGVTGFVNIDGVDLEVKPKFLASSSSDKWRKLLWNILLVLEDSSNSLLSEAGVEKSYEADNFVDLLGWAFLNSIQDASLEGFPRGYQEQEGVFSEIKGSIDYSKISSVLQRPFMFPCKYDEYVQDIPVNRLLKWAGVFLSSHVKSFKLSSLLNENIQHIHAESSQPPGLIEAENIRLSTQFHYIETAFTIAKMLLKHESLHFESSPIRSFGFLWKSHDIYEDFLHKILILSSNFLAPGSYVIREETTLVAEPFITTNRDINEYPDYKIIVDNEVAFVVDAKYKTNQMLSDTTHGLAKTSDINQVIVACKIDKCLHGILIFPGDDISGTYHQTWKINDDGFPKYISNIYINLEEMYSRNGEYILAKKLTEELKIIHSYR